MTASDTSLPRRWGRYVLFERLGGGGMAEVYKARIARKTGPERILVVKLLPVESGPDGAARFVDEASIALPLTHGNITATFEFDRHEGRPFLVMEYVHGRSLREIVGRLSGVGRGLGLAESVFVAREVARALRYAHSFVGVDGHRTPIVHRDVSPENVLVSYSGQTKLTDFGIARSVAALDRGGAWGKPAYVAPEILAGDPGGPASDVYSLGCVLYEVLAGWPPLLAATERETLELVLSVRPAPVDRFRDGLPPELVALVTGLLEKAPAHRRPDAAGLEIALSQILGSIAPHFTEADLSQTVLRLFQEELRVEASRPDDALAARLREQLSEAGLVTSGAESASELLAMGTVALGGAAAGLGSTVVPTAPAGPGGEAPPLAPASLRGGELDQPSAGGALLATAVGLSALIVGGIVALLAYGGPGPGRDPSGLAPDAGSVAARAEADLADGARAEPALPGDATAANGDPADEEQVRPRRRHGTLTFNSVPWSFVYLDGTKLPGHTPIRNVKARAGRHQVRFVNPELGLSKVVSVRLAPGEEQLVKVRLQVD